MNLSNYVSNYKDNSFEEYPFNTVDAIVMAQLSYLNFDFFDELKDSFRPISDYKDKENIALDNLFTKKNIDLINIVSSSNRYKNLEVGYARFSCDEATLTYYMSVTFKCNNKYCITYRGTDMSIIGWKEDFNMLLLDEIPSQLIGLKYAKEIMDNNEGNFYIAGHSKGGNLALFASTYLKKEYQDRLIRVFDFDGPGFKKDITKEDGYNNIKSKVRKVVPQSDIVGILLNHIDDYYIVRSNSLGILQHDLYTWQIDGNQIELVNKQSLATKAFDKSLSNWIESMTDEEKIRMLAIIFQLFDDAGIKSFSEFKSNSFGKIKSLLKSAITIESKDKKMMFKLIVTLMKFYVKNFFGGTMVVEE